MNKKFTLLIIVAVFVLVLGGASVLYNRLSQQETPDQLSLHTQPTTEATTEPAQTETTQETAAPTTPDLPAPDFTVYDKDGNPLKLSDYFGKPIVLNFWASWCGPCRMEMPDFQEKSNQLEGQVHFLMINMTDGIRETVATASSFIDDQGYTFPVFFDTDQEAAYFYGVTTLPTTYFIDSSGNVIARALSAIDADTLQRGIDMIS